MEGITTIINLKQVRILGKMMQMEEICFSQGVANIARGYTDVLIQYEKQVEPIKGTEDFYYPLNYFIGDVKIGWSPRQLFGKTKDYANETVGMTKEEKESYVDNQKRKNKQVDVFSISLPNDYGHKRLFEIAVENLESIMKCKNILLSEDTIVDSTKITESNIDNNVKMLEEFEKIWYSLEEKGLVIKDKLIIPKYIYVLPFFRACPKALCQAYRFHGKWLTPNVFETEKEENFIEMMKNFYYTHFV